MQERVSVSVLLITLMSAWLIPFFIPTVVLPAVHMGDVEYDYTESSILFVGDIMLGRHVETLTKEHGRSYPFHKTEKLLARADITIGNFEGAVPKKHVHTPDWEVRFSIEEDFLTTLTETGFDILSLANNHALDFSEVGLLNTKYECLERELICLGHPDEVNGERTLILEVGEERVGLLFFETILSSFDESILKDTLRTLRQTTDFQIAYVHWGTEYELVHTKKQEEIAHLLIDEGVDVVIGHHPHVVEDVEIYKEKPIFYSLGNFIFDQYFNSDVEMGLGVELTFMKDAFVYTLIPFISDEAKSQPRIMGIDERTVMLDRIFSTTTPIGTYRTHDTKITIPR